MSEYNPTAAEIFRDLCSYLDNNNWHYETVDGKYIKLGAKGEDLPIELSIGVQENPGMIRLYSFMPFKATQEKMVEICMALALINNRLSTGRFEIDLSDYTINFSMNLFYEGVQMTHNLYELMLIGSCRAIDDYNDKLLMLCKGLMTFESFLKEELDGGAKA